MEQVGMIDMARCLIDEMYSLSIQCVKHCGGDRPYIHPKQLEVLHREIHRNAIEKFSLTKKMGGKALSVIYLSELENEIEELYGMDAFKRKYQHECCIRFASKLQET
jgi:hypothetical protein